MSLCQTHKRGNANLPGRTAAFDAVVKFSLALRVFCGSCIASRKGWERQQPLDRHPKRKRRKYPTAPLAIFY